MANENLNVPVPPVVKTIVPLDGVPATLEVDPPAVATPDLLRQQGLSGHTPQSPSTPAGAPAAQTLGGGASTGAQNAAPPPIVTDLVRATPNGIAAGTENPRAVNIGVPVPPPILSGLVRQQGVAAGMADPPATPIGVAATPSIVSSTAPVPVGDPTLTTAAPIQAANTPRVAGVQLVPPTPPATQVASQLSQSANAPQAMQGIATMLQKP